jgi:hypothetical protein
MSLEKNENMGSWIHPFHMGRGLDTVHTPNLDCDYSSNNSNRGAIDKFCTPNKRVC